MKGSRPVAAWQDEVPDFPPRCAHCGQAGVSVGPCEHPPDHQIYAGLIPRATVTCGWCGETRPYP